MSPVRQEKVLVNGGFFRTSHWLVKSDPDRAEASSSLQRIHWMNMYLGAYEQNSRRTFTSAAFNCWGTWWREKWNVQCSGLSRAHTGCSVHPGRLKLRQQNQYCASYFLHLSVHLFHYLSTAVLGFFSSSFISWQSPQGGSFLLISSFFFLKKILFSR